MNIRLDGERALVCGASQGIGRAVARTLADLGAQVTVLARDAAKLDTLLAELPPVPGGPHRAIVADMSDTAGLAERVATGIPPEGITILVNNTGGPPPGAAHEAEVDAYARAFRQHLLAFQTLVRMVVPGMKERRHGRIVNVISTSVKQPLPDLGVSNTIRGAVANWGKTLANELGPHGITVNNVLPGATATDRLTAIVRGKAGKLGITEAEAAQHMMREIPLRRFARPEEFAWAVAFLVGPSGAYITGINLPVDGGRTGCL